MKKNYRIKCVKLFQKFTNMLNVDAVWDPDSAATSLGGLWEEFLVFVQRLYSNKNFGSKSQKKPHLIPPIMLR